MPSGGPYDRDGDRAWWANLEQRYCRHFGCGHGQFMRHVFWHALHRPAVLATPFLGGFGSEHYRANRDLLAAVAQARDMHAVREEIRDFFMDPDNRWFSRRVLRLRISAHRLLSLAAVFLEDPSAHGRQLS